MKVSFQAALLCMIFCAVAGHSAMAIELFSDNFNDNSLDPTKWTTATAIPQGAASVVETGGQVVLTNRGYLISVPQFDPVTLGGISVKGTWNVVSRGGQDFFQLLTRSNGVIDPGNCCGETQHGIEFFSNINGAGSTLNIIPRGSVSVANIQTFGTINAQDGMLFDFEVRDNRGFLSMNLVQQGNPANRASLTARLNSETTPADRIVFHNRENGTHVAAVDNVSVAALSGDPPQTIANVPTGGNRILPTNAANGQPLAYRKGSPGWTVTDTFYNSAAIVAVNNGSGDDGIGAVAPLSPLAGVHNALIARGNVNPANVLSSTTVSGVPVLDFSDPQSASGRNYGLDLPFVGNTGADDANFTTRAVGFIEITTPGSYTFRHSADDTTYLQIDTVVDGTFSFNTECCASTDSVATFTQAGLFPIEFVFGENGGQAGVDLLVNGPGTNGNFVLVGDVLSGSPAIFLVNALAIPEPSAIAMWILLGAMGVALFCQKRVRRGFPV